MKRHALISVTDKTGVVEAASALEKLGYAIIATGGTAKVLEGAGCTIIDAGTLSGYGELLGGRVKTLSPVIFAGILCRRENPGDLEQMAEKQLPLIDVVICNLYDFDPSSPSTDKIDIGGVSLIRAAAKNARAVTVLVDPADYSAAVMDLASGDEARIAAGRTRLASKAWDHVESYDANIAAAYRQSPSLRIVSRDGRSMRYGENPHQEATWWRFPGPGLHDARIHEGKELSYNNLLDLSAAIALADDIGPGAVAVIKHQNPCGAALKSSLAASMAAAVEADRVSAFGGIVAAHGVVDEECCRVLEGLFLEVVVANGFTDGARRELSKRKNIRIVEWPERSRDAWEYRSVPGGILVQSTDRLTSSSPECLLKTVSKRDPDEREMRDMKIAESVVKHVRSNAIVLVKDGVTVGIGAGQMNRADSVRIAVQKAGEKAEGAVMASDAFFPFADGIESAKGVSAVIQPGGSVRDEEVIAAADKLGMALVFTGARHFRH